MKSILIIEDDLVSADRLKKMIYELDDTLEIDGPLSTIQQVIARLKIKNNYDLIFSDIHLGNHNIFEAFHEIMPNCFVVYTTADDNFAMEAIHTNGIDYLLKPFDINALQKAINKICLAHNTGTKTNETYPHLEKGMEYFQERFLVCKGDEFISIYYNEISCFQRDKDKIRLISVDGKQYSMPISLGDLENRLDPRIFFRINRKYIANINHINKISTFFNSKLILRIEGCYDNDIIVSKERAKLFKEWLNE
jgi:two-component system response regulator LytT